MTPVSRRVLAAAAVLATLVLSACAVPGQGEPGVAATYGDVVVTNQQVSDASRALLDLGTSVDVTGAPLTLILIGPEVIAKAESLGLRVTDGELRALAVQWIAHDQRGGEVTLANVEIVHALWAMYYLLTSEEGFAAIEQIADDAEAGVVASPRYGTFARAAFDQTMVDAINQGLADPSTPDALFFTVLLQVNGFESRVPAWISVD